jgi:hypothetical protein
VNETKEETMTARTTDPTTGLPELPEGFFWRVTDEGKYSYVKLKKTRKRFWAKTVADSIMETRKVTKELIRSRAWSLLEGFRFEGPDADLFGDYPPKSLT